MQGMKLSEYCLRYVRLPGVTADKKRKSIMQTVLSNAAKGIWNGHTKIIYELVLSYKQRPRYYPSKVT